MESTLEKAKKDSKELFSNIDNHFELLETNTDYKEHVNTFNKGQRLLIDVEVVSPEMTHWLYQWLYNDAAVGGIIPFGCKVNSINFGKMSELQEIKDLKHKLLELYDSL